MVIELFMWRLAVLRVLGIMLAGTWECHNFCCSGARHELRMLATNKQVMTKLAFRPFDNDRVHEPLERRAIFEAFSSNLKSVLNY